jgi:glycosyltransferase involved in cell wall biosynthesis
MMRNTKTENSTIQPRKNLAALIAAFARLGTDLADYRLVIAGSVGWLVSEVFAAVQKHHVQDRVVFTGRVSQIELESLYMGAKLYVQPSITEGFGLPVLEAMKYGVPVIGSDGGALGEVIGKAGIIVSITNQKFSNSQIESGFVDRLAKNGRVLREPNCASKWQSRKIESG